MCADGKGLMTIPVGIGKNSSDATLRQSSAIRHFDSMKPTFNSWLQNCDRRLIPATRLKSIPCVIARYHMIFERRKRSMFGTWQDPSPDLADVNRYSVRTGFEEMSIART